MSRPRAAGRIAATRAMIEATDRRLHGIAAFLEHSGMARADELVSRLAHRAEWLARRERYRAETRVGRQ